MTNGMNCSGIHHTTIDGTSSKTLLNIWILYSPGTTNFQNIRLLMKVWSRTKCRLPNIIYAPDKPTRWGLKIWCRCDAKNSWSCYLFKFEPYMGKKHTSVSRNGLYHDIVYRLCSDLKGSNVKLFFDSLYCSLALLQDLQNDHIYGTGMLHKNHLGLHPTVKQPPQNGPWRT